MNQRTINPKLMTSTDQGNRIFFLDLLKAVNISIVVFFHALFLPIDTYFSVAIPELILSCPLRFCVPLLLIISFFLLERDLNKSKTISPWIICKKRLVRIAIPTAFWFGLTAFLNLLKGNSLNKIALEILTGNIFIGAYFLLILLQLIPIFVLTRVWFQKTRNVLIIVGLQIAIFVAIKVWAHSNGIFGNAAVYMLSQIDRPFIIYWFVYLPLGYFLYHHHESLLKLSSSIAFKYKIGAFFTISFLLLLEYAHLIPNIGSHFYTFEYALIACIGSALIVFFCACSIQSNQISPILLPTIYLLSRYSLGIFCINGILSQVFSIAGHSIFKGETFGLPEVIAFRLIGWIILLFISLGVAVQIDRFGFKALVR
ncbi:acyltransferase family protein [Leptolyngbya sp. Cla-17]|uniref:acyltransferase family protein n=1 Tax=Leptolyngbya sp. Cla-17 TaxID=2803751 RepID=UPI0019347BC5|nr:acyltransferase family protein [Leptolyngbya sp. Cla-17]